LKFSLLLFFPHSLPFQFQLVYQSLHLLPTLFNRMDSQSRSKAIKIDSLRTPSSDRPSQVNNTNIL
jgi:hypothetical protein